MVVSVKTVLEADPQKLLGGRRNRKCALGRASRVIQKQQDGAPMTEY